MISDWHIKRTFTLIKKEKPGVSEISRLDLRRFYIQATENNSAASFIDFVGRCRSFGFLIPNREHRPVLFQIKKLAEAVSNDR